MAVDEARGVLGQRIVVQAQGFGAARREVRDEHVDTAGQAADGLAFLGRLDVGQDAALAAIPDAEAGQAARRIPAGRLDLDHVGALVGQEHGGVGPSDARRQFEDGDAVEGACQELASLCALSIAAQEPLAKAGSHRSW